MITDINLIKKIQDKLDTDARIFNKEELMEIKDLCLDAINFEGEFDPIDLKQLSFLSSLEVLYLSNYIISDDVIKVLNSLTNLREVKFIKCRIEGSNIALLNLKVLGLLDTVFEDLSFLDNLLSLEELYISHALVDLNEINTLTDLKVLSLFNSEIKGDLILDNLDKLIVDNKAYEVMKKTKKLPFVIEGDK